MENDYINSRLNDQINWYDRKSNLAKKKLLRISFFSAICSSLIPIFTLFIDNYPYIFKIIITFLSQCINICTWYICFNKLQEISLKYRSTCESLKTHKILFENNCTPYDISDNALKLLITNCECIMDEEHKDWVCILEKNYSIGS
ncbi:DUF4231 domain-containing protein [Clostridium sp. UBA871]|uniref:DUF4231 domain-containing protein n=1 Tax=Clostridium sp. UBA871 TaxID=1946380 RepID=UPI0039C86159